LRKPLPGGAFLFRHYDIAPALHLAARLLLKTNFKYFLMNYEWAFVNFEALYKRIGSYIL
jgi:hypothetical protein